MSFIIWIIGSVFYAGGGIALGNTYGIYQITASTPSDSKYCIAYANLLCLINSEQKNPHHLWMKANILINNVQDH
ncbi:MAG: hypothetical protein QXG99_03175 [Conexivisphaerales archaeon]